MKCITVWHTICTNEMYHSVTYFNASNGVSHCETIHSYQWWITVWNFSLVPKVCHTKIYFFGTKCGTTTCIRALLSDFQKHAEETVMLTEFAEMQISWLMNRNERIVTVTIDCDANEEILWSSMLIDKLVSIKRKRERFFQLKIWSQFWIHSLCNQKKKPFPLPIYWKMSNHSVIMKECVLKSSCWCVCDPCRTRKWFLYGLSHVWRNHQIIFAHCSKNVNIRLKLLLNCHQHHRPPGFSNHHGEAPECPFHLKDWYGGGMRRVPRRTSASSSSAFHRLCSTCTCSS